MTKAINTYNNLRKAEARRGLYDAEAVLGAMLHVGGGDSSGDSNTEDVTLKAIKKYKADLNYKTSAWDKLDTETNLKVLTGLLLDWLEHLKVSHGQKGRAVRYAEVILVFDWETQERQCCLLTHISRGERENRALFWAF